MLKICDIVQFYSPLSGGVKRYIRDKMQFLGEVPGAAHVVIVPSDRNTVHVVNSSRIYEIRSPPLIGSISYRVLLDRARMAGVVAEEDPDLIEVGDPYRSAWIAADMARDRRIPIVAYYHSDYPRALGRTARRFGGRRCERAVTRMISSYLVKLYGRMDATVVATMRMCEILSGLGVERLVRIPLGTNTDVFYPRPVRGKILAELGLDENVKLLLYVGRIAREKNIRALVSSLEHLPRNECHLVIVGDGEQAAEVAAQSRLRSNLSWIPYCDSPDRLAELYSAANLVVHSGTSETLGLVSLEAQACGTRVVAVRGGGVEETLEGENPLILAEEACGEALAAAVREALHAEQMGGHRRRRRRIVEGFSSERAFRNLLDLYVHLHERRFAEYAHQWSGARDHSVCRPVPCS
jgi:alpha-1,6-mannosyltransferase